VHLSALRLPFCLRILTTLRVSLSWRDSYGFVTPKLASDSFSVLMKATFENGVFSRFFYFPQNVFWFIHFSLEFVCFLCSYSSLSTFQP